MCSGGFANVALVELVPSGVAWRATRATILNGVRTTAKHWCHVVIQVLERSTTMHTAIPVGLDQLLPREADHPGVETICPGPLAVTPLPVNVLVGLVVLGIVLGTMRPDFGPSVILRLLRQDRITVPAVVLGLLRTDTFLAPRPPAVAFTLVSVELVARLSLTALRTCL